MAAFFNDDTHPLLLALYEGNVERIHELMPQTDLDEKHRFEIEHEPTVSRIPVRGNGLEFVMQLFGQDAPISSEQVQQWKRSLNALLEYNEVMIDATAMRFAVKMMEHRRVSAKDATDVLKTLDGKMANWLLPIFEYKKETYLDSVARHLPTALPKLRNAQFIIRKKGFDTIKLMTEPAQWVSNDGFTPWFAWYPVKINGERKFLETIERKRDMNATADSDQMYSYRQAHEPKLSPSPINPLRARRSFV